MRLFLCFILVEIPRFFLFATMPYRQRRVDATRWMLGFLPVVDWFRLRHVSRSIMQHIDGDYCQHVTSRGVPSAPTGHTPAAECAGLQQRTVGCVPLCVLCVTSFIHRATPQVHN